MTGEVGDIEEEKDTQAPTIPTNIKAAIVTSDSVQLSWNPSTDNTGVTGYNIYRNGQWLAKTEQINFSDLNLNSNSKIIF
ncbi:fibronectin type III domain-containing protein [Enterococcus durans]|uniref:fibronectin type III domain-containing protein n=1 Tax=Enterococcus durans TaxID=53345 RepID=UPI0021C44F16|nr:fibronectin type III domain-containing protein [Enterococcus durans]